MLLRDSRHPGLRDRRLSGEGINSGSHNTFLTTPGHGGPPRMRNLLNAGATSETTRTWKTMHTIHAPIHSNKANMKGCLRRPNDIRGPGGPKASWHLSYRWGKTPKNLIQETSPDQVSNPVPLRDRRACYRLLQSGGHTCISQVNSFNIVFYCNYVKDEDPLRSHSLVSIIACSFILTVVLKFLGNE